MCPGPGSNRHGHYCPQDFKSGVSTNSTTGATLKKNPPLEGGSWSERRDSNPRPRPWQGRALPAELLSLIIKRTNSGAKTPNLRFLGLNFSKLSLTLSTLWANFQVQGVDLQLYPGSQQSRTEEKFGKNLRKSCNNVI